jgi:antirestriction protein ArdC
MPRAFVGGINDAPRIARPCNGRETEREAAMSDIYQAVTDRIVAMLERGAGTWRMPWHTRTDAASPLALPVNVTGRAYRGCNAPLLWATAEAFGYGSPIWATYRQWHERGAQVRKGERATLVIFWKAYTATKAEPDGNDSGDDGDAATERRLIARGYSVFNAAQVDGYDPATVTRKPALADLPETQRIVNAERFFAATGAVVNHGGNRAFYSPGRDTIQLPEFGQFRDAIGYYSVRGHEAVHWTGHERRCNREFGKRFGDKAYAFEELVAELGTAYLAATLGLTNEPRPDHAAYLQSWLECLRNDRRAIFTAASKAQVAVDFLLSLQPGAAMSSDNDDALALAA